MGKPGCRETVTLTVKWKLVLTAKYSFVLLLLILLSLFLLSYYEFIQCHHGFLSCGWIV